MKNSILIIISAIAFLLSSCEKDITSTPEIQTVSITAPSTTGATFKGNISGFGSSKIVDHGFLYGYTQNLDEKTGTKLSLGEAISLGEFSTTVDDLVQNSTSNYQNTLFVRSYIVDQRGTVYGATMSAALPVPTAGRIFPSQASAGDTIRISGKFFSPNIMRTEVLIGQRPAQVLAASDTVITAIIPSGILGSHGNSLPVVINLGATTANYYQGLTLQARYTGFTPESGPIGTIVTLTGDNLPDYYSSMTALNIWMSGVNVPLNYNSYNRFAVPFNVDEKSSITVMLNGKNFDLPGQFVVTAPEIVSFTNSSVFAGRQVTMQLNSSAIVDNNGQAGRPQVKIGSGSYINVSWYNREVSFTVPANTAIGEYDVYFKVGPHEIQSPTKLKVIGYSVSSFQPAIAAVGNNIEISGSFIAGEYYTVYFGSRSTSGVANSTTKLIVPVPSGVDLGKLKLSVETPSGRLSVPGEMEIIGPSVTSVSPLSGVPGTKVTIRGNGFGANAWNNNVAFGWNYVTPQIVDSKTMEVYVPSNIGRGKMSLSIIVEGQMINFPEEFTIL
ncbi:IPT/TIG domain-containing protein [Sphingobacterium chungjuense]|uniref:IPT/TIG domain-containing protein n=1 Tax=Sphingobacterium chungjuense TaxID=2675553 RepID=UPI001408DEEC|nr:IPT/TIG domain-containing protein [Sphingobacterium chungjuense]